MAKKRISELPAGSALNGTELVAIVQSGTTKRTTAQDIANLGNASGVEGSGTIDYIAKFTASSTIGDSIISDNGTMVTIDGDFRVALADANVNLQGSTKSYLLQVVDGNNRFRIYDNTANEERFTISSSGEASFSNSVTANSFVKSGGTSAQYLKADGSVSTLTNPITGTGTTNYLPKFTGTSALGNSLLQEGTNAIGLGATPSAWGTFKVLQVGSLSSLYSSPSTYLGHNVYYNSENKYITNGYAQLYGLNDSGQYVWYQAPSGTAGNAISFTQAMTLDASGQLGIGTASPANKLDVNGSVRFTNGTNPYLALYNGTSTSYLQVSGGNLDVRVGGANAITFNTNSAERMRILSDGTICVGRTTNAAAGWQMAVKNGLTITDGTSEVQLFSYFGAGIGTFTNHDFTFRTNNTERMRLFSDGNLALGSATNAGYKLDVNGNAIVRGRISTIGGSSNDVYTQYTTIADITNTNDYVLRFRNNAGTQIGYIGVISSGGVFQYNNSNGHNFTGAATFSSSVTTGGNATFGLGANRPVTYDTSGGNFRITANAGGWATGYFFNGSSGTFRGGFGGYGGADALTYYWIGTDYNTATLYVDPVNNRVGINNSSPAYTLDVAGTTRVSSNSNSYIVSPHAAGIDIYSTGNIAPHYQTTYTWYTGAIGSGTFRMGLDASGNLTAGSFIKSGGTSAQFLKANGSIDSSAYISTLATITGNIDSDYGECFVTFDPIPSGTPPIASPNIRTINVGNSYSRRTQLAFDYASDTAFFRRRTEAGWFTWREFIHSGNVGSYALPLTGGNLTGLVISTANIEASAFRTDGNFELTSGPKLNKRFHWLKTSLHFISF